MKLAIFKRSAQKKSDSTKVRLEGKIPAVLYGSAGSPESISIKADEMAAALRQVPPRLLATTLFKLEEEGKEILAIIKEIQRHPVSSNILHIDFQRVKENEDVTVNVPIQIANMADSVGFKLGGFVRQPIRSLKVRCKLKDLPKEFTLDILNLGISEVLRLSDIAIPEGVKPIAKMNEVAVVIAKKA